MLAASLLQWSAEDLPFRELAFAILCLAAGGRNISVIAEEPSNFRTLAGSNTIVSKKSNAKEFIASLGTDFHLRGNPVGSSPEATVYWFEGALIVLKPQLFYDSVLDEGLCYIQNYCQENCPEKCVNAVLISIEHVVLVKVTPGEATQYSGLLTLVFISNHTSWDAKNRYHKTYLSKLQAKDEKFMKRHARELRKKQREKSEAMGMFGFFNDPEDEVVEDDDGYPEQVSLYRTIPDDVEGPVDPNDAFFGLAHLFEACAQQHMPPTKPSEGRLPTEIYAMILDHVYDRETRYNCREVSRTFRNLVQAHFMITDDYIFERNQAMESTIPDKAQRVTYIQRDIESGVRTKVRTMKCSDLGPDGGIKVATGPEQNRKSRLPGTDIKFVAQN